MFSNQRARSGVIVLPCGAGKTLVGITAACTIKKGVIILCTSGVSVEQWRQQFLLWTSIDAEKIIRLTRKKDDYKNKKQFSEEGLVLVSTYTMMADKEEEGKKRSANTIAVFDMIKNREWGLLILDEVQVAPANSF